MSYGLLWYNSNSPHDIMTSCLSSLRPLHDCFSTVDVGEIPPKITWEKGVWEIKVNKLHIRRDVWRWMIYDVANWEWVDHVLCYSHHLSLVFKTSKHRLVFKVFNIVIIVTALGRQRVRQLCLKVNPIPIRPLKIGSHSSFWSRRKRNIGIINYSTKNSKKSSRQNNSLSPTAKKNSISC